MHIKNIVITIGMSRVKLSQRKMETTTIGITTENNDNGNNEMQSILYLLCLKRIWNEEAIQNNCKI